VRRLGKGQPSRQEYWAFDAATEQSVRAEERPTPGSQTVTYVDVMWIARQFGAADKESSGNFLKHSPRHGDSCSTGRGSGVSQVSNRARKRKRWWLWPRQCRAVHRTRRPTSRWRTRTSAPDWPAGAFRARSAGPSP
jgi:hypothetical protein